MQKIYEWRSSFGANAIKAIRKVWDDGMLTTVQERARIADMAIGGGSVAPYLYGRVVYTPDGSVAVSGTMLSMLEGGAM